MSPASHPLTALIDTAGGLRSFIDSNPRPAFYEEVTDLFEIPRETFVHIQEQLTMFKNPEHLSINLGSHIPQEYIWMKKLIWCWVLNSFTPKSFFSENGTKISINEAGYQIRVKPILERVHAEVLRQRAAKGYLMDSQGQVVIEPHMFELTSDLFLSPKKLVSNARFRLFSKNPRSLPLGGDMKIDSVERIYKFIDAIDLSDRRDVLNLISSRRYGKQLFRIPFHEKWEGKKLWYLRYICSTLFVPRLAMDLLIAYASREGMFGGSVIPKSAAAMVQYLIGIDENYNYLTPEHFFEWYSVMTSVEKWKIYSIEFQGLSAYMPRYTFNLVDWTNEIIAPRSTRMWFRGNDVMNARPGFLRLREFRLGSSFVKSTDISSHIDEFEFDFSTHPELRFISYDSLAPVLVCNRSYVFQDDYRVVEAVFYIPLMLRQYSLATGVVDQGSTSSRISRFVESIPVSRKLMIIQKFRQLDTLPSYFDMIENLRDSHDKWYARYLMSFFFISPEIHQLMIEIKRESLIPFLSQPITAASIVNYYTSKYPHSSYITIEHVQWWYSQVEGGAFYKLTNVEVADDEPFFVLSQKKHETLFSNRIRALTQTGYETGIIPFTISSIFATMS